MVTRIRHSTGNSLFRLVVVATIAFLSLAGTAGAKGTVPHLGIVAGPGWGNLRGDGVAGWTGSTGYRFGFTLDWIPESGAGFESAIYFSKEHVRRLQVRDEDFAVHHTDQNLWVSRIELCPVSLRLHLSTKGTVKPYVAFAPVIGFNFRSNLMTKSWDEYHRIVEDSEVGVESKTDFGIAVDGGLGFRMPSGVFFIGAGYYYGLLESVEGCVDCVRLWGDDHYGLLSSTRVYVKYAINLKRQ